MPVEPSVLGTVHEPHKPLPAKDILSGMREDELMPLGIELNNSRGADEEVCIDKLMFISTC